MDQNISILIIEDDPQIALRLEALVHSLGYQVVSSVSNSEEALETIHRKNPDVLVVDIDIEGNLNGIEVVNTVKHKKIPVIFVTGHKEGDIYEQARAIQPAAYLVKPFNKFTFQTALENAVMNLSKEQEEETSEDDWQAEVWLKDSFFIKRNNLLQKVKIEDIQFIQSDGNYCEINSSKKFAVKMSLTQLMKKLPARQFVRIHQRYIIQADLIEHIDTSTNIIYVGGKSLPLGPKFKDDLMKMVTKL